MSGSINQNLIEPELSINDDPLAFTTIYLVSIPSSHVKVSVREAFEPNGGDYRLNP